MMIEQVSVWNDLDIADPDFGPVLDNTKFSAREMFLSGESNNCSKWGMKHLAVPEVTHLKWGKK